MAFTKTTIAVSSFLPHSEQKKSRISFFSDWLALVIIWLALSSKDGMDILQLRNKEIITNRSQTVVNYVSDLQ